MKLVFAFLISIFLYTGISLADDRIDLMHNIIPDDNSKNNSVIDSQTQKKLNFKLYTVQGPIYFNNTEIDIVNSRFEIDISNLVGKQEIKFTNNENEVASFTYYISDSTGLIKEYMIENEQAYVKTLDSIKILYTIKDSKKMNYITNVIKKMPEKTKINLKEITLLPTNHPSKAAGITDYNKVRIYNISSYTNSEIQRIITHEIAHTWAHELRKNKIIDYSYTNFGKAVNADNNFVTDYSKNSLSEDFADSVAFYLADNSSFSKKFPARSNYISALLLL